MVIDELVAEYTELFEEIYGYSPDKNPFPSVGKKRNLEGIGPRNPRGYRKLHIIDTRLREILVTIKQVKVEMYEWRADYEKTK